MRETPNSPGIHNTSGGPCALHLAPCSLLITVAVHQLCQRLCGHSLVLGPGQGLRHCCGTAAQFPQMGPNPPCSPRHGKCIVSGVSSMWSQAAACCTSPEVARRSPQGGRSPRKWQVSPPHWGPSPRRMRRSCKPIANPHGPTRISRPAPMVPRDSSSRWVGIPAALGLPVPPLGSCTVVL